MGGLRELLLLLLLLLLLGAAAAGGEAADMASGRLGALAKLCVRVWVFGSSTRNYSCWWCAWVCCNRRPANNRQESK
jgi:hypothetical protein